MTDFVYGMLTLHGAFDYQLWLDVGWIGSYVLWGVAGLHPSMARLAEPAPRSERLLTRFRLVLLTLRLAVAPALAMADDIRRRRLRLRRRPDLRRSRCSRSSWPGWPA